MIGNYLNIDSSIIGFLGVAFAYLATCILLGIGMNN